MAEIEVISCDDTPIGSVVSATAEQCDSHSSWQKFEKAQLFVSCPCTFNEFHKYLTAHAHEYNWVVSYHDCSTDQPACHDIEGSHYHWLICYQGAGVRVFTDTSFWSKVRRVSTFFMKAGTFKDKRFVAHEPMKSLCSSLLYFKIEPRTLMMHKSCCIQEIKDLVDSLTPADEERMSKYIEKCDMINKAKMDKVTDDSNMKVNLENIVDLILDNGCCSFEQWSSMIFKLHPHDHMSRKLTMFTSSCLIAWARTQFWNKNVSDRVTSPTIGNPPVILSDTRDFPALVVPYRNNVLILGCSLLATSNTLLTKSEKSYPLCSTIIRSQRALSTIFM